MHTHLNIIHTLSVWKQGVGDYLAHISGMMLNKFNTNHTNVFNYNICILFLMFHCFYVDIFF